MIEEKNKGNDLKETVENTKSAKDNQYVKFEEVLEKGEKFALTTPPLMFDAAKKIAIYNNLSADERENSKKPYKIHPLKSPAFSRTFNPNDYTGYHDVDYGSGISCKYIEDLDLYLSVIDLDNHENEGDINMEDLKEAFGEYIGKTRTIITQSSGIHIYLLSKEEPKIRDLGTNIDYQTNNNLVVLNYIHEVRKIENEEEKIIKNFKSYLESNLDKIDEIGDKYRVVFDKKEYKLMDDCTPDILVVDSSDEVLLKGLKKLEEKELYTLSKISTKDNKKKKKTKNNKSIKNGKNEKEGDRTLDLKPNEIEKLGLLFEPGRRHHAGLYLTGYLARQGFTKDSIYQLLLNFDTTENKEHMHDIITLVQGIFDSWENGTEIAGWNALSGLIEGTSDLTSDKEEIIKILENLRTKKNEYNYENCVREEGHCITAATEMAWESIIKKPEKKAFHMQIALDLEALYNIKRVINNGKKEYYYYNSKEKMFEDLNGPKLGILVKEYQNINLPDTALNSVLSCVQRDDIIHNDKWLFKNCLFDAEKFEVIDVKNKQKEILCTKKLGVQGKFNKINMLEYIQDVNYINDADDETLIEKTLKQILIPKNDLDNHDLYFDYLQRVGASLLEEQYHKTIPIYKGEGDNAKSILNILLGFIFNRHHRVITPKTLEDQFSNSLIENTSVLAFDELKEDSFRDFLDYIKKFSGGGLTQAQRRMYSDEISEVSDFGMIWCFTNEIPKIPLHEKALFRRLDVLELPNTFVDKKYLNDSPNNYLKIEGTQFKLKKDIEGLSWLISASIKAYKEMVDSGENFRCKQTADETLAIINKTNYLETFLALYTEIDDSERTKNSEIYQGFKEWIEFKELPYEITEKTPARIGYSLRDLYETKLDKKTLNGKKVYNIKMKSRDEVEKSYRYIYEVCECDDNTEYELQTLDPDARTVLNEVRNGNNSINKIKDIHDNIQVTKHIKILEREGIINNTFSTQTIKNMTLS